MWRSDDDRRHGRINADLIDAVLQESDLLTLRLVEAVAHERIENQRLRDEKAWLTKRISDEDARLANA